MTYFLFGLFLGGFVGVTWMALLQINRCNYREKEDQDDRNHQQS
jgi:hypothetical protein